MLKNYPATHLFLLSLIFLMGVTFITPIVGVWHIYCAVTLKVITFILKVICVFFLFGVAIDAINGMNSLMNGIISKKKLLN